MGGKQQGEHALIMLARLMRVGSENSVGAGGWRVVLRRIYKEAAGTNESLLYALDGLSLDLELMESVRTHIQLSGTRSLEAVRLDLRRSWADGDYRSVLECVRRLPVSAVTKAEFPLETVARLLANCYQKLGWSEASDEFRWFEQRLVRRRQINGSDVHPIPAARVVTEDCWRKHARNHRGYGNLVQRLFRSYAWSLW